MNPTRSSSRVGTAPQIASGQPLALANDGKGVVIGEPGAPRIVLQHQPAQQPVVLNAQSPSLGTLDEGMAQVIAGVVAEFPSDYSPAGSQPPSRRQWSPDEVAGFIRRGTIPRGAPNELDFMKRLFTQMALHLGTPGDAGLQRFLVASSASRSMQDFSALVRYYFAAPGGGELRFLPPPFAPAPGADLAPLKHYGDFRKASGLGEAAFERLCGQLSPRAPFFEKVFADPAHKAWGQAFFTEVGKTLHQCGPGEAAAVVLYHRDCYGIRRDEKGNENVGKGITHISVMALSPNGDVCVNHQESITFASGASRNLMTGSLGLVSDGYDTRNMHERVAGALGGKAPAELPVDQSFRLHGGPAGMVTRIRSFEAFQAHTAHLERRGASEEGLSMLYAADPDHVIRDVAHGFQTGKLDQKGMVEAMDRRTRLRAQPDVPALDGKPGSAHLDYTNNCTFTTLLALKAGGCDALDKPQRIASSSSLHELQQVLLDSRLMPYTDPTLPQRARSTWADGGDKIVTKSFLMIGTGQATQMDKGIPADIPHGDTLARARL